MVLLNPSADGETETQKGAIIWSRTKKKGSNLGVLFTNLTLF